jgi:hypothetical protein
MSGTGNSQAISKNELDEQVASVIATKSLVDQQAERNWIILEPEEKAFAQEYVINGYDHRNAADKVGYSPNTGLSIKRRPYVAAYIEYLLDRMHASNLVVKGFIDAKLDDLYDMAIGDEEVPLVLGDGSCIDAKKFHGGLALQILQERSKVAGIVKDEKVNQGQVTINIDLGRALGQKDSEGVTIDAQYTEG